MTLRISLLLVLLSVLLNGRPVPALEMTDDNLPQIHPVEAGSEIFSPISINTKIVRRKQIPVEISHQCEGYGTKFYRLMYYYIHPKRDVLHNGTNNADHWTKVTYKNLTNIGEMWNPQGDTHILIHGLEDKQVMFDMGKAFADNGFGNVIVLHWSILLSNEVDSMNRQDWTFLWKGAAEMVARVIRRLHERKYFNNHTKAEPKVDIHIIGSGMGAEIASMTGKYILKLTGKKIGRISAIYTMSHLFDYSVFSTEYADFVDVYQCIPADIEELPVFGHLTFISKCNPVECQARFRNSINTTTVMCSCEDDCKTSAVYGEKANTTLRGKFCDSF